MISFKLAREVLSVAKYLSVMVQLSEAGEIPPLRSGIPNGIFGKYLVKKLKQIINEMKRKKIYYP
jgi:hypothetical protein